MILGIGIIAVGVLSTLFGVWHARNAERASDLEKKLRLTDWGARRATPAREAAQGCLAIVAGPVIIVVGIWVAIASMW